MLPATKAIQRRQSKFQLKDLRRFLRFALISLIGCAVAVTFAVKGHVSSIRSAKLKGQVTIQAAERGRSWLKMQNSRELRANYPGASVGTDALDKGTAKPLTLATGDLDHDGAPDLVIGYSTPAGGLLVLQRGNIDAFAPQDTAVFQAIQQGRMPESFLPSGDTFSLLDAPDFLQVGDFDGDGYQDILAAARGGQRLDFLSGYGKGDLRGPVQIDLPGQVTTMATGRFDRGQSISVALGVNGANGPQVLIFDGLKSAPANFAMPSAATSLQFGQLDKDSYSDLAVTTGQEVDIIHGSPSQAGVDSQSRIERVPLSFDSRAVAIGEFTWDRDDRHEMAVLATDGAVHLIQAGDLDTRPLTAEETYERTHGDQEVWWAQHEAELRANPKAAARQAVETAASWQAAETVPWTVSDAVQVSAPASSADVRQGEFGAYHLSFQPTLDLMVVNSGNRQVGIVRSVDRQIENAKSAGSQRADSAGNQLSTALDIPSEPVAVLPMPRKVNGERDLVILSQGDLQPSVIIISPLATVNVNITTDTVNACSSTGAQPCSIRDAVNYANTHAATTVNIPANTYSLTLADAAQEDVNASGDLDLLAGADGVSFVGAGAATTIIQQTDDENRIFQVTPGTNAVLNWDGSWSGLTMKDGNAPTDVLSGGAILMGGTDNTYHITSCTFNNNVIQGNIASNGGAIAQSAKQNGGAGQGTVTSCTFTNNRTQTGVGGAYRVLGGTNTQGTEFLNLTNSTFNNNEATTNEAGGIFFTSSVGTFTATENTFTNNKALDAAAGTGGGGIQMSNGTLNLHFNRFKGNTLAGASNVGEGLKASGATTVANADENWWACNGDPTTNPAGCDSAVAVSSATLTVNPRLNLTHTANPTTLCRSSVTTLTASFLKDSSNGNVAVANLDAIIGLPVTFNNAVNGAISSPQATIQANGTATATFTTGANHGPASADAIVDNQTVSAPMTVPDSFSSAQTGSFDTATTWTPQCVPQSDDSVTINNTHTVSLVVGRSIADVAINGGGTLNTSTFNLNVNSSNNLKTYSVANTWSNSGNLSGLGTITFNGNGQTQTLTGTTTFNNLSIQHTNASNVTAGTSTFNVNALLHVLTGTFVTSSNASTLKDVTIDASSTLQAGAGQLNVGGDWTNGGSFTAGSVIVNMNGAISQTIGGAATTTFSALTLANTTQPILVSPGTNLMSVSGNLTINAGAILSPAAAAVINGTGTLTGSGTARVTRTAATPDFLSQYTINNKTLTNLTVDYNATAAQVVSALNYNNLTISSNRGGASVTLAAATIGVSGVFNPSATNVNYITTGNTFDFNGAGTQTVALFSYNNLTISGNRGAANVTLPSGTIGVAGIFLPSATNVNYIKSGNVFDFNGTSTQAVAPFNYNDLTISGARGGANITLGAGTIGVAGVFNPSATGVGSYITAGNTFDFNGAGAQTVPLFNYNGLTISGNRGAANVTLSSGTIGVAGTFLPSATNVSYLNSGSLFDFNGAGAQAVPAFNYNDLTISGARGGANITLGAGTIGVAGVFNPSATGVGSYITTGNTFDFNGAGAQGIAPFSYNSLTISGARGGANITLGAGTIGVAGVFNPSATGVGSYIKTGNVFDFNGTSTQAVPAFNYNDLTISGARGGANITLGAGTIGVAGVFNPSATGVGSYVTTGNTFDFNGAGAQGIAPFSYNSLTISGARGGANITLGAGTIGVAGVFNPSATGVGSYITTGNTFDFNGAGTQTVPIFSYNDLTISNTHGANAVTLVNGGTIGVAGVFLPGTSTFVITGNVVNFNGAGTQTIPAFNFNDLTISNTHGANAVTLINGGTIGVAGVFTPGTSTFVTTGNTMDFNGAGTQTVPQFNFNNLTISNTHGANAVTLVNGGTIGVAGTFTPGTSTFVITGNTFEYRGSGTPQTLPSSFTTYNNLTLNNPAGTTGFAGLTVQGLLEVEAGTFTSSSTYNNVQIDNTATLAGTNGTTINVSGNWTNNGTFTANSNEVIFAGNNNTQTITGTNSFFNLTINHTGLNGVTAAGSTLAVTGLLKIQSGTFTSASSFANVEIDNGGTLTGTNATTMDVSGNWVLNTGGVFTPSGNTVNFNGAGAQTIGGTAPTTFNNLTIANAGAGVSLALDATVNGLLTLTNDLNTGAFTLTLPASGSSTGAADVVGNVQRTGFSTSGANTLSFGNPLNTIQINSDTVPGDTIGITFNLVKTVPSNPGEQFPGAVKRTYTITPSGITGTIAATLQLHYNNTPGELNGNTAGALKLWKFVGPPTAWQLQPGSVDNGTSAVSLTGVTGFSPWTISGITPSAANGNVSGRIVDNSGNPVEGAAVRMSGSQNRLTVTDAQGNYQFDNVESNGFYTVVPTRSNYSFSPSQRAFSQLGQHTDAAFNATPDGATANPLDSTEYFVRQQYVDFLNREPDESGLNFWVNNIENCGNDANCRAVKRTDTSAAFFLSVEFQQTGYLVYRTYQAAFGDLPGTSVPINLSQFKPDAAEVGNGVVVNKNGWETVLDNNKQAFTAEFVQRPRFASVYPTSMTPSEFVDQLFTNAGVRTGDTDRAAAISEFGSATTSSDVRARGRALRRVAENSTLAQQEFTQAFVLMEYFGYLRRDANTGPDTDFTGYNFWLDKLNTFGGNYQNAEMVKSFLVSGEYRGRFPR